MALKHAPLAIAAWIGLAPILAAQSVVPNASFEELGAEGALLHWSLQPGNAANVARIGTDRANQGSRSLFLKATPEGKPYADCLSDRFPVEGGVAHVLEFSGHGSGAVFTHFCDADGKEVRVPYWKFNLKRWARESIEFTPPTGTVAIALRFRVYSPSGQAWIDCVEVRRQSAKFERLTVPNPSAEEVDPRGDCVGWWMSPEAEENVAEVTDKHARYGRRSFHIQHKGRKGVNCDVISNRFPVFPGRAYALSFDVRGKGGCVFAHTFDSAGSVVPVPEGTSGLYFAYGSKSGEWERQAIAFSAAPSTSEMYLRFRVYGPDGEAWIDGIQIDDAPAKPYDPGPPVQLRLTLPHHAFVRGATSAAQVVLSNMGAVDVSGSLAVSVRQHDREFVRIAGAIAVPQHDEHREPLQVPTAALACGRYELAATLTLDDTSELCASTDLVVAQPFTQTIRYGFYGYTITGAAGTGRRGPKFMPPNIDAGLDLLSSAHMNVFNATVQRRGEFTYFLDGALARGIGYTPLLSLYFGKTADSDADYALTAEGQRIFVHTSKEKPDLSLISECARRHAAQGTKQDLAYVKDHPAFINRFYYGDDVAMWRGDPDIYAGPIQDYSPAALAAFKSKTGLDAPRMTGEDLAKRRGILPDDDPWVQWTRFRCKDIVGGYQAAITAAKNDVAPEAKGGPEHGAVWWPGIGAAPTYELGAVGLLTYYAYPHYAPYHMFHCALAFLGGRDKELWATPSAHNNIWGPWFEERTPEYERSCFFSILASGAKAVTYCPFQSRVQFSQGHPAAWAEFRRLGQIVQRYGEWLYALRQERQPLALLISLTNSGHRVYDMRPRPYHIEDTHAYHVAGTFFTLLRAHMPVEMLDEESILAGDVKPYKAIMLADVQVLPQAVAEALEAFVKQGGAVFLDDRCQVDLADATKLPAHFDAHPSEATPEQAVDAAKRVAAVLVNAVAPVVACDSPNVAVRELDAGGVRCLFFVNMDIERAQAATVRWPSGTIPHDVFASKPVSSETLSFEPGGGAIVALLPKPITGVNVDAPAVCTQTEEANVTVRVAAADNTPANGVVPVQVTFLDPAGQVRTEYGGCHVARDGALTLRPCFALSDAPGEWTMLARELFSGRSASARFTLRPALDVHCTPLAGEATAQSATKRWRVTVSSNLTQPVATRVELAFNEGVEVSGLADAAIELMRPGQLLELTVAATVTDEFYAGPTGGELRVGFGPWTVTQPMFTVFRFAADR